MIKSNGSDDENILVVSSCLYKNGVFLILEANTKHLSLILLLHRLCTHNYNDPTKEYVIIKCAIIPFLNGTTR